VSKPRAHLTRYLTPIRRLLDDAARSRSGPVGLGIGADSAESIALPIPAELHAVLAGLRAPRS
jgi:xanthine/CO dehydrogenase XdhC/CoxF family maturation factor